MQDYIYIYICSVWLHNNSHCYALLYQGFELVVWRVQKLGVQRVLKVVFAFLNFWEKLIKDQFCRSLCFVRYYRGLEWAWHV